MSKTQWIAASCIAAVMMIVLFAGSVLLTTGILLGLLTLAGFAILYNRIQTLQKLAVRFPGASDVLAAAATYVLFGSTVTGLIAAAVVGLGTSFLLDTQVRIQASQSRKRALAFASATL